jgi:monoamine oxidase
MVNMALDQLEVVHGMSIPQPVAAVFKDWGADPFGAGYHAWAVGRQPWDTYDRMLNPMPMPSYNRVFICGEAYSLDQGWVEGALRTAETVFTKYFKTPPPEGVHPDYVKVGARHHGY